VSNQNTVAVKIDSDDNIVVTQSTPALISVFVLV